MDGLSWQGGLFWPRSYRPGRRYPLVIQTHGFSPTEFRPSGIYPTAFAAYALAGSEMFVLQVQDCPITVTTDEGRCNVDGYERAIQSLSNQGLIDSKDVGIVRFI
jgi:hypothetical protein